jgi:ATP-dependent DNA helicase RecG
MSHDDFAEAFPAEDEWVEFKEGFSQKALAESIVAFTNADGGVLLIGVRNDGTVVGTDYSGVTRDKIHTAAATVHSPGDYEIRRLRVAGKTVVVISVDARRESFAQTASGRVLVRRGTMRVALVGNELAQFMFQRSLGRFERLDTQIRLDAADERLVRSVTGALGISARNGDIAKRLAERQLVDMSGGSPTLTVAGALCLMQRPADALGKAFIEITRHPRDTEDYDRRVVFDGPAFEQVVGSSQFIFEELGMDLVVLGLRRHELPRVPLRVLREALANAVAHRSYELRGTAVRVELRPDRIDIRSPGLLPPPVTVETMRDSQAARNDAVLTVLRGFDLAEDKGLGVDLIQDRMRDELLDPPSFREHGDDVVVTLPVRGTATPEERAWVREIESRGEIEPRDRVLLVAARRGETLTNARARSLLNVGRDEATRALRRLTEAELIERHGERSGTKYTLRRSLRPPAGLRLSRAELLDAVATMATREPLTNAKVRAATGLDRNEVLGLLDELVRAGRLLRVGERKGTRYLPGRRASSVAFR